MQLPPAGRVMVWCQCPLWPNDGQIFVSRTANLSWSTCVVVKQMQSNPHIHIGATSGALISNHTCIKQWDIITHTCTFCNLKLRFTKPPLNFILGPGRTTRRTSSWWGLQYCNAIQIEMPSDAKTRLKSHLSRWNQGAWMSKYINNGCNCLSMA